MNLRRYDVPYINDLRYISYIGYSKTIWLRSTNNVYKSTGTIMYCYKTVECSCLIDEIYKKNGIVFICKII